MEEKQTPQDEAENPYFVTEEEARVLKRVLKRFEAEELGLTDSEPFFGLEGMRTDEFVKSLSLYFESLRKTCLSPEQMPILALGLRGLQEMANITLAYERSRNLLNGLSCLGVNLYNA